MAPACGAGPKGKRVRFPSVHPIIIMSNNDDLKPTLNRLSELSAQLNTLSDELAKPIDELDEYLKKLNLGLKCWITISDPGSITRLRMGYDNIGRWGLVLGIANRDAEVQEWLFNNAPRWLRLRGIRFLPELFEALMKTTEASIKRVEEKTVLARVIVKAITEEHR